LAQLGLAGMVAADGTPEFADYITRHQRRPGIGLLAGWGALVGLGPGHRPGGVVRSARAGGEGGGPRRGAAGIAADHLTGRARVA